MLCAMCSGSAVPAFPSGGQDAPPAFGGAVYAGVGVRGPPAWTNVQQVQPVRRTQPTTDGRWSPSPVTPLKAGYVGPMRATECE